MKKWLIFLKAQASSFTASVADFLITVLLKDGCGLDVLSATVSGTVSGGIINFLIGRFWVFGGKEEKKVSKQALRYIMVWNGNLILTSSGVYLLSMYAHVDYKIAKVLVSFVVGISYNYFMQKLFVFK